MPSSPLLARDSTRSITNAATCAFLVGFFFVPATVYSENVPPVIHVDSGLLAGIRLSIGDRRVDAYMGIPYAEAPVGDLRFQKPRPVSPWKGVYNATSKPKACKQLPCPLIPTLTLDYTNASEDCLYVNVWKPASLCAEPRTTCKQKFPVYVFIHGGGFQWGDSALLVYDPANFVALTDVIVVTFNYRVGINGFLSLEIPEIPGNMGLWDQNMVLKWVQRNIASFGGDPNDVTLGGQSAGSTSVGLHVVSPHSRGLFKRAIMQSGAPLSMIATLYFRGEGKFINVAGALGCYDSKRALKEQLSNVLACLRRLDSSFIINTVDKFDVVQRMFAPIDRDDFLPLSILTPQSWMNMGIEELLLGTTLNEATMFLGVLQEAFRELLGMMKSQYRMLSIIIMAQTLNIPVSKSKEIVRAYFGADDKEHSFTEVQDTLSKMLGDAVFDCPVQFFADSASQRGVKTYRYLFGHRPAYSFYDEWMGVAHGEDLFYTMGSLPFINDQSRYIDAMGKDIKDLMASKNYTPKDEAFMKEVVAAWGSFIKTGKPMVPKPGATWKRYGVGSYPLVFLKPDNYTTFQDDKRKRCAMWKPILYRDEHTATVAPSAKPTKRPSAPTPTLTAKDGALTLAPAVTSLIAMLVLVIVRTGTTHYGGNIIAASTAI